MVYNIDSTITVIHNWYAFDHCPFHELINAQREVGAALCVKLQPIASWMT